MARQLMILEVSQKQAYIFASRKVRDNRLRSAQIAYVTGSEFFEKVCPELYGRDNLVYAGGGHTVLQFSSREQARAFGAAVSRQVMQDYPGMELFIQQREYDEALTPGENLLELSKALETKKSHRIASFRYNGLGVEDLSLRRSAEWIATESAPPDGWNYMSRTEQIAADVGFLAVVHLDGNAMGTRVQKIYDDCGDDWERCRQLLQLFSAQIDQHFDEAFTEMAADLGAALEKAGDPCARMRQLPLRRIIGAGDDVCFVTAGDMGLECAASFLRHLNQKVNEADRQRYTACAGVVLIHSRFPFRKAYDLSEALCSNAKQFCAERGGNISGVDYHIEFGTMKDSLGDIRQDYFAEDGTYMELRPLAVTVGEGAVVPAERRYQFFMDMLEQFRNSAHLVPRSKLKQLRTAIAQGEVETRYALRATGVDEIVRRCVEVGRQAHTGDELYFDETTGSSTLRRCLFFDAIEWMDHTTLWKEGET